MEALDPEEPPRLRPTETLDDFILDAVQRPPEEPRAQRASGAMGVRWLRWALELLPVVAWFYLGGL